MLQMSSGAGLTFEPDGYQGGMGVQAMSQHFYGGFGNFICGGAGRWGGKLWGGGGARDVYKYS